MPSPKVTIAMPVYNGGHYFRLALESAFQQTYANIEIVVVNDGSTDGGETEAIAREYGPRITYIHQPNRGVGGALNTAVQHMTGDFFTWLSHDDIHLPQKAQRQVEYFTRLGKPDAMLISDYELIDPEGKVFATARMPHQRMLEAPILPLMEGCVNGCTLFIPADIMRKFGPFKENLRHTQDYELWNRMLVEHDFFHQPEVLVQYRIHPGQDSKKPEMVAEGDALWIDMLQSRNRTQQINLFGSRQRYYHSMTKFLDGTPYKKAAAFAREQTSRVIEGTLVSVVLPFFNEVDLACRAARSALAQTHTNIEVIAVDDGSTESTAALQELAQADARLRVVRQVNAGPGAARNRGMQLAAGEYIAFLDADDTFLPQKIERQLQLMEQEGCVLSHTSYYVRFPEHGEQLGLLRSGRQSGFLYPEIIAGCAIAMPTVMMHRTILANGFAFPVHTQVGEDLIGWIELAMRHKILGVDEPLSVVEWSSGSAALSYEKSILANMQVLSNVQESPIHRRHHAQIARLLQFPQQMSRERKTGAGLLQGPIVAAFGTAL